MIARALLAVSREDLRSQTMAALAEMPDIEVVGAAENSSDLLLAIETSTDIDLVLVDDQIGNLPYLALTREVVGRRPDVAVLLLTTEPAAGFYQSAMDAGARAVIESPPSLDDLVARVPAILEWQRHVRSLGGASLGTTHQDKAGRLIAFTGAKGGVGTTTAALHVALLAVAVNPERRVCLVDFDLQQRGVRQLLDMNGRRTISDLSGIADSMTGRNLDEAVFVHQSGLRVLLAPEHGEHAEDINGEIARQVLAAVKGHYDLVVVDCGNVVTEASAVGMEFADDIALVTTADVPSLRATYDKVELLSRLQIAKSGDLTLLFNKVSSRNEVQPELGRRMTGVEAYKVALPDDWKRLESASNSLAPLDLENGPFRRAIIALGRELRLAGTDRLRDTGGAPSEPAPRGRRSRKRRKGSEEGQVTSEALVGIGVAMVIFLVLLQVTLFAIAAVSSRRAADAAALAGSRSDVNAQAAAEAAAEDVTLPMFDVIGVASIPEPDGRASYEVTLDVPIMMPFLERNISATGTATN